MTLTNLSKWDPFRELMSLQDRVGRAFLDPYARVTGGEFAGSWFPPVDIFEENDRIILRAEVPGIAKDDIDVHVENGTITLRGEKKQEKQPESEGAYRVERFYGSFSRSFVLPTTVDPEGIKATCKDGVLEVVLPKAEEARPRKIKVLAA
ncbi:MAG: Hsp20/alpha crystallin family protein [Candidatus Polarisedimenticolia bacterium]